VGLAFTVAGLTELSFLQEKEKTDAKRIRRDKEYFI